MAIVTERWDGMRWTLRHRARNGIAGRVNSVSGLQDVLTSGAEAYGKSVWTRCLKLVGIKSCGGAAGPTGLTCRFPRGDGGDKGHEFSGV
ncbi:MAG: hypothetical protein ABIL01_29310, partial [Pseudomonadota bacterium]